jgi:aromatic ring-opening dioxygenase catalytic subunit (LigB family)
MIGEALRPLLEESILFIGSGFTFHNMRQFDSSGQEIKDPKNNLFQDSLGEICCSDVKYTDRREQLINWESIPGARYCHPREEHLLPLHVCVGLGEGIGEKIFDEYILGKRATAYLWTK